MNEASMNSDDHPAPSLDKRSKNRLRTLVLAGITLHLVVYLISYGSFDVHNLQWSGQRVLRVGIVEAYRTDKLINHPPLATLWFAGAQWISVAAGIGFPYICKLPMLAANVGTIWLLLRMKPQAAVAFALSPIAILVAAYHCNTDPIYACFAVVSLYLLNSRRKAFAAGLMMAAALNVKLMVVPLAMALVIVIDRPRDRLKFVAGTAFAAIPYLLLAIGTGWRVMWRDIFAYSGNAGHWGVSQIAEWLARVDTLHRPALAFLNEYEHNAKWLLLLAAAFLALRVRERKVAVEAFAAMVACLFFVISPSFGMQYTIYPLPLILWVSVRWGIAYSILGGLALIAEYSRTFGGFPFGSSEPIHSNPAGPMLSALLWMFCVATTAWFAKTGGLFRVADQKCAAPAPE